MTPSTQTAQEKRVTGLWRENTRPCEWEACKGIYFPSRRLQRFCSSRCRDAFHAAQYRAFREANKVKS